MKCAVASSLEQGDAAFRTLGEILVFDETNATPSMLHDVDALIVRSKTCLNKELLDGTPVRFAATATAGIDHVDLTWLEQAGIRFYAAHGCNANAVTEYVLSAMLEWSLGFDRPLAGCCLGIIGVGQVGGRLVQKAEALGMKVLLHDPPRAEVEGPEGFSDLETVFQEADIISVHVPLIDGGRWPTRTLLSADNLSMCRPGVFLINASRGEISTEAALIDAVDSGQIGTLALDVFPEEPVVSDALLERCRFATPHIAGHSFEGKANGTAMCLKACADFMGLTTDWRPEAPQPPAVQSGRQPLHQLMLDVYDIRVDDQRFREGLRQANDRTAEFNRQRRQYPLRFEAAHTQLKYPEPLHLALGFSKCT